jgi:hypothetical protein
MRLAVPTHNREIERRVRITFEELLSTGNIDPGPRADRQAGRAGFGPPVSFSARPSRARRGREAGRGRPCGAEQN